MIGGEEAIWFDVRKAGVTPTDLCKPFPNVASKEELIKSIVNALQKNVGQTRQSGCNVIFAAIALLALHDHVDYATPQIVGGIRKLTEGFNDAHPGRGYYGTKEGWRTGNQVRLADDDNFPNTSQFSRWWK